MKTAATKERPITKWSEMYIFREVSDPLPPGWLPGHWQVEAHRVAGNESYCCPVGIAWVNRVGINTGMPTIIEFVHVLPQFQRQGVAWRLMLAVLDRWHDVICTDAIAVESEQLVVDFWEEAARRWNCKACRGIWPARTECRRCKNRPTKRAKVSA